MNNYNFRTLYADEIECRVGQINKNKDGFTLLLYKDARCDMALLDEVVGSANWARDHKEVKNNMFCGVSINIDGQWVTKWDCGTESNTEKEKGEASDSFKRACVNWGIGRELYTSPAIRIKGHVKEVGGKHVPDFWDIRVSEIGYNDKRAINRLVITGDGEVIFEYSNGRNVTPKSPSSAPKAAPTQNPSTGNKTVPTVSVREQEQREYDELKTALKYGVQGQHSTMLIGQMNKSELEATLKYGKDLEKKQAQIVKNAIDNGKAHFVAIGIEAVPF